MTQRTGPRVGLFGNIANSHFQLGRALRAHSSLDVVMFADVAAERIKRPESDYPDLAVARPDWVHEGPFGLSAASVVSPWRAGIVEELRGCDAIVASGYGPVFAPFAGRPWAFLATGGDLTMSPFPWRFRTHFQTPRSRLALFGLAPWQRRAIRRAAVIWAQPFSPNLLALDRLGVEATRVAEDYLPFVLDADLFRFSASARESAEGLVRSIVDRSDFVVFHPSRLMMDDRPIYRASGQWKANDIFLRAFVKFVESRVVERPLLVLPDRTESPDVARAKAMMHSVGMEDYICWATPPRPGGFTRHELIDLYSVADVVADDFGIGWFGTVVLEGLSIGKPVISYVDDSVMRRLYPWHPICSSRDPDVICGMLVDLARDEASRRELGRRGRTWIKEFHAYPATAPRYAAAIRRLLECR